MKILHVIPAIAARYGGPSTAVIQMCRALAAAGAEVHLTATDADGRGRLAYPTGEWTTIEDIPTILFRRQFSEALKYSAALAAWLQKSVSQYDVVHVHALLSHACLAAAAACRANHVPYVVRPLGTLDRWSLGQKPWRKRVLLALNGRKALAEAAGVHYTAIGEQRLVEGAFETKRGFVVPLGIDDSILDEEPVPALERDCGPYVLALSRLHPVKALDALIDAFGDACTLAREWRLVIAGDGDEGYVRKLKVRAAESAGATAIEFRGWVNGDEKRDLLRRATLYALPSHHENFGVSLAEALARGVPAIVSSHVLISDDLAAADAAWVTPNDRASLAATLLRAMTDQAARETKSVAARQFARDLAWPRVASRLLDVYASLLTEAEVPRLHPSLATPSATRGL
jgi:glycosyltransferase involved in cell wall biosynthesis